MTKWVKTWWIVAAAWEALILAAALSASSSAMATLGALFLVLIAGSVILAFLHLAALLDDPPDSQHPPDGKP